MQTKLVLRGIALLAIIGWFGGEGFSSDLNRHEGIIGKTASGGSAQETGQAPHSMLTAVPGENTVPPAATLKLVSDPPSPTQGNWYVSTAKTIDDHSSQNLPGTLAWVLATIGSAQATVVFSPGSFPINGDMTINPSTTLHFMAGATIQIAPGRTVTIASPEKISAGQGQHIFKGPGRVTFTRPGVVEVGWWGADATGTSDAAPAITAAKCAATVGSTVKFQSGTYLVQDNVSVDTGINLVGAPGYGTVLKAGSNMRGRSVITYAPRQPHIDLRRIEYLRLDGGGIAENGLEIKQAYGLTICNMGAHHFTGAGFYVNGDSTFINPGYGPYIYVVNFDTCSSNDNRYGYHLHKNANRTAFAQFTFTQSGAYSSKEAGLWLHGDNSTTSPNVPEGTYAGFDVKWSGGQIENTRYGGDSIRITNGVTASFHSLYLEPDHDLLRRYANGYVVRGGSSVEVESSVVSYPNTIDGNSTLCTSNSLVSYAFGVGSKSAVTRACIGDRISDKLTHGPPNFPDRSQSHGSGFIATKGTISLDSMGTRWLVTTTGKSDNSKWVPMDGRIIVPFDFTDSKAPSGKILFWAQEDFVITAVDVVINRAFVLDEEGINHCNALGGSAGITVGTIPHRNKFISETDGALLNLTSGRVIRAYTNVHPENVLGSNKAYLAQGNPVSPYLTGEVDWDVNHDDSYLTMFFCPSGPAASYWTVGSGYVVIYGYPLKFN